MKKRKEKVKVDRRFVGRIVQMYRPFWRPALIALGILLINQGLGLVPAYVVGRVITGLTQGVEASQLVYLVLAAAALKVADALIGRFRINYEYRHIDYKLPERLSLETLRYLFRFSPGQNRGQNSGKIQSIIGNGESALTGLLPLLMYNVFPIIGRVVVTAIALLCLDLFLGGLVTLTIVIFVAVTVYITKKFDKKLDAHQSLRDYSRTKHTEVLRNLAIVQTSAQEGWSERAYAHRLDRFSRFGETMWQAIWSIRIAIVLPLIIVAETGVLLLGIWYVSSGRYEAGTIVMMVMWTGRSLDSVGQLSFFLKNILESLAAIKKYFTIIDTEPAVKEISAPVRPEKISGRIEFQGVSFRYPDYSALWEELGVEPKPGQKKAPRALRQVNFTIEAGERVALVGHSGAGKTTIISLLLRAYDPNQGAVLVDGYELRTLDLGHLRHQIGVVEQNVSLFDTSLKENILFGLPEWQRELLSDEDLLSIVEAARISEFQDRLTEGLHTKIGENGIFLSGGERQRVGIARALVKNPAILVLDEATSNLDAKNERAIKEAIDVASRGRTTIIIAHRLSTVRDADRIFVFSKGEIAGQGTHHELLTANPTYQELVACQLAD